MRFPPSNNLTDLIQNNFKEAWRGSSLVWNMKDSVTYGFRDISIEEVFPWTRYLTTNYELSWDDFENWSFFFRSTWAVPVLVSIVYALSVPLGQRIMKPRAPMGLRYPLFLWNLGLAIFSIVGTLRVLPTFLYGIARNGFTYFICREAAVSFGRGPIGFWSVLFVLSKYAELLDTLFLILRKKPVPFLHWYHHASVLLLSIGTIMIRGPTGIIMIAMNYFVHSVMYSYYAIAAVSRPPRWGKVVTILQIAQMVGGLCMCVGMYRAARKVENCEVQSANGIVIALIYASYFLLFVQFYIGRYVKSSTSLSLKKSK